MSPSLTTQHEIRLCPACEHPLNESHSVGASASPIPGSIALCAYCASALVYEDGLTLRLMTDADAAALLQVQRDALATAQRLIRGRTA